MGVPVLLIAGAVFATSTVERNTAIHAGQQQQSAQQLLTAMLDQETGARGYFQTRDARFLQPWYSGTADFSAALSHARALAGADPEVQHSLDDQQHRSKVWHAATQTSMDDVRAGQHVSVANSLKRKVVMDGFRASNTAFENQLRRRHDRALSQATWLSVGVVAALSVALAGGALLLLRRLARIETERLASQTELRELMQVSESEEESRLLLIRHIERAIPGVGTAVLIRNNSDDRLEPILSTRAAHTPLKDIRAAEAAFVDGGAPQPLV